MTSSLFGRPARVLLVEDNPGDALLTREAFEDAVIAVDLTHVEDVDAAVDLLDRAAIGRGGLLPDLVLLDLNLPGRPGMDVLEHVRSREDLEHLPIIVLTSSKAPDDVHAVYKRHANSFITKPMHAADFIATVKTLEEYWLTVVRLPSS